MEYRSDRRLHRGRIQCFHGERGRPWGEDAAIEDDASVGETWRNEIARLGAVGGIKRGHTAILQLTAIELLDLVGAHFDEVGVTKTGQVTEFEGGNIALGHLGPDVARFVSLQGGGGREKGQRCQEHRGGKKERHMDWQAIECGGTGRPTGIERVREPRERGYDREW